ncbi:MAG: hypothetical protein R3B07_26260 [Polyangiaceae bacterium]
MAALGVAVKLAATPRAVTAQAERVPKAEARRVEPEPALRAAMLEVVAW